MDTKREYERTHPWIDFTLDLRRASQFVWLYLGQASSMASYLNSTPVTPRTRDEMHKIYLAKGIHATAAIEGNTLSEDQVRAQLEGTLKLPPSMKYQERETQNIIEACNLIMDQVMHGNVPPLTPDLIKAFNLKVLDGTELEEGVVPGEVRTHEVGVADYRAAPARDCEHLLERLVEWIHVEIHDDWLDHRMLGGPIMWALIKSALAHLYIAWIHPFGDGNGRTARLVEFWILIRAGVPSPAAHLLSNHYNETRKRYYEELGRASGERDVFRFMEYALEGFVHGLIRQTMQIQREHRGLVWQAYTNDMTQNERAGDSRDRRRAVAVGLSQHRGLAKKDVETLNPKVAGMYAQKGNRAVQRDLNRLMELGLVLKTHEGLYHANTGKLLEFLPLSNDPELAALRRQILSEPQEDREA